MRGGSLRRYTPTSQDGGGILNSLLLPVLERGGKAVGKAVFRKVQKRVRKAVKRKASQLIDRVSKRARKGVIDVLGP